jgi:hypothetical protein
MTIYNVTVNERCGGPSRVHAVDADVAEIGRTETGQQGADTVLRFFKGGVLTAAFYDWDWFCKGVLDTDPESGER